MKFEPVNLSAVADFVAGYAFKSQHFGEYPAKVVKIAHIIPPTVNMDELPGVDISKYDVSKLSKYIVTKGDYVLAMTGATIGKIGRIPSGKAYINQRVLKFIPKETIDKDFLYYVLLQNNFSAYIHNHIDSESAQPNISANTIGKYEFMLPPLKVQRQIGGMLRTIDDRIQINNAINKNLDQQGQALVKKYCDLNPSKTLLGSIMTFANGFAFQSSSYLPYGTYKIITIKNVQDGEIDSQGSAYINDIPPRMKSECLLHIGDVLLSLTGNVGRVGIVCEDNLLLNQRVAKLVPNDLDLLPYLYFYFRLPESKTSLETIAKGTAQQNLSPVETLKLDISYDKMVKELSQSLLPMFRCIIANQKQNQRLSDLRDTLLPRLMSGELDVSNLDL